MLLDTKSSGVEIPSTRMRRTAATRDKTSDGVGTLSEMF